MCQRQLLASHIADDCLFEEAPCLDEKCDRRYPRRIARHELHSMIESCEDCGADVPEVEAEVRSLMTLTKISTDSLLGTQVRLFRRKDILRRLWLLPRIRGYEASPRDLPGRRRTLSTGAQRLPLERFSVPSLDAHPDLSLRSHQRILHDPRPEAYSADTGELRLTPQTGRPRGDCDFTQART